MAPFSIPAPSIIPLRLPVFGGPKSIDTNTRIQILCETYLEHEIFYTLDGTKPQPYAGIVQGNKTIKYESPFCLPPGKSTIKAIAINANIHTMCSNIVTKCFDVLPVESDSSAKKKTTPKSRENSNAVGRKSNCQERACVKNKLNSKNIDCNQNSICCLETAFIETLDVEFGESASVALQDNGTGFSSACSIGSDVSDDRSDSVLESEDQSSAIISSVADLELKGGNESSFESHFQTCPKDPDGKAFDVPDAACNMVHGPSTTQFCCMKCDMTLQQCLSCNKMNAVSSKFCIECGTQLIQVCAMCKQHNPSIAVFCQFCGRKLMSAAMKLDFSASSVHSPQVSKVDHSVMVKPKFKNVSIQKFPACMDKGTQTQLDKTFAKKSPSKSDKKDLPPQSPGRGYWRLQLDYICNHLKTHAYNNLEFRKVISEPSLCQFKSAHVTKDNENVTVTVVFSPLAHNQCNSSESEDSKSKGSF